MENEYGSFGACDREYLSMLKNIFLDKIQDKALLYTTDGTSESMLRCGSIPGIYATVDFGSGVNVTHAFEPMRAKQPKVSDTKTLISERASCTQRGFYNKIKL